MALLLLSWMTKFRPSFSVIGLNLFIVARNGSVGDVDSFVVDDRVKQRTFPFASRMTVRTTCAIKRELTESKPEVFEENPAFP